MSEKETKRVKELVSEFRQDQKKNVFKTAKLKFSGVDGHDVYNITAPFRSANRTVIAGRVEPRDHEYSNVVFFEETDGTWAPIAGAPVYNLQDPFITYIRNELVFGGVQIKDVEKGLEWRTVLFRGPDIFNLVECFIGPAGMKDIRLCDLQNGKIAVFTRPQGEIGGRGKIGYVDIDNLEGLTIAVIESATLLHGMFHPMDWGGVNEAHLLTNGEIGVLAHAACYENDHLMQERHYYAKSFIFNPVLKEFRDYKIIASRDQFEAGPAKRADLANVIFSSGLIRIDGKATLYAGVSDAESHWIEIDDPFMVKE
ncbi:hypothetical protein CRD36_08625 [Paremcibacter congregatus]|uniref:DUF1861 domain-containing protein n=2 Tax=Paremcibacter congregatus TaxID=2043170 RepID=A0A2G4YUF3_9PROT|nr:DUF1861 family protein [Paremcibacter congregatus]PHZ85096.1 hypothetical protein CRD36_08625 [Paremcibacter congregatus]QDE27954.1 DUF1861 family protein [Paremcibacter congregatus]